MKEFPYRGLECFTVGHCFILYSTVVIVSSCVRLSAIMCSHSVLRPQEEIERLRLKARVATSAGDGKQWPTGHVSSKKTAEACSNSEVQLFSFHLFNYYGFEYSLRCF
jgi:hypothetical protein